MPKQRDFSNLYKKLNILQIPEEIEHQKEFPLEPAQNQDLIDEFFNEAADGYGHLLYKGKWYKIKENDGV